MAQINYNLTVGVELASYIDPAGTQTKGTQEWTIAKSGSNISLTLTTSGAFDPVAGTGTIEGFQVKTVLMGVPTVVMTASSLNFEQNLDLKDFLEKLAISADAAAAFLLSGKDDVVGTAGKDLLRGFDGDDYLSGGNEQDILIGGAGSDFVDTGQGDDLVIFNAGDGGAIEQVYDSGGTDTVRFDGSISVPLFKMDQIERLQFGAAAAVETSQFIDNHVSDLTIICSAGQNILSFKLLTNMQYHEPVFDFSTYRFESWGTEDRFMVTGTGAADLIRGPNVAATIDGGAGDDFIVGRAGADTLIGGIGADTLVGGKGNDSYRIDAADEILESAGGGTDLILSQGSFSLANLPHVENLGLANAAGKTSAKLTGNALANTLTGDAGANTLAGGLGKDKLYGLGGKDVFVFNTALSKTANVDTIYGFVVKDDTIKLENAVFKALGKAGSLHADKFHKGRAAADAEDRIVYDSKTGALYYDSDGVGGAAQIRFATLSKGLGLTYKDFLVI
jgi:Ca2+-binding RTX toxin-like protein